MIGYTTGAFSFAYEYDDYGRLKKKTASMNGRVVSCENYNYQTSSGKLTNRISSVSDDYFPETEQYYDACGNITSVWANGRVLARYNYDQQNRLTRELNERFNSEYTYAYDRNGNLISKTKAESSTGENATYTYDGDKMTSYNGEVCVYDAVGNPTTYRGKPLVWTRGKLLDSYNGDWFEYDCQGERIFKLGHYLLTDERGRLVTSTENIEYFYEGDSVIGCKYNGEYYYFKKDLQGNIWCLLDSNANIVVNYVYDAWGNHKALDGGQEITNASHVGNVNCFRYRGYIYDRETGLYYLKSRYYDPQTGRFINMDGVEYADPSFLNGLNLYAYCNNNPVMYVDPNGNFFLTCLIVGLIVGAAVGFGAAAYKDYKDDGEVFNGSVTTREYVVNTLLGGVIGGMAGAVIGAIPLTASNLGLLTVGVGTVTGGTWKGVESYRQGNRGWDVVLDTMIGASAGMAVAGWLMSVGIVGCISFWGIAAGVRFGALGFAAFNLGNFL